MPPVLDFPKHLETEGLSPAQALALAAAGGILQQSQGKAPELPLPTHVRDVVSPYDVSSFAMRGSAVSAQWEDTPASTTHSGNLVVKPGIFAERIATNPWPDIKAEYRRTRKHDWQRTRPNTYGLHYEKFDWFFKQPDRLNWLKNTAFADVFPPHVVDAARLGYEGTVRKHYEDRITKGVYDGKLYPYYHRDYFTGQREHEVMIGQLLVAVPYGQWFEDWTIDPADQMRFLPTAWIIDDVPGGGRGIYHSQPHFGEEGDFSSPQVVVARFFLFANEDDVGQPDANVFAGGDPMFADYDGNEIYLGGGAPREFAGNEIYMQAANLNPDLALV